MKESIKRFESMVFFVRQTRPGPFVFSLCYFLEMPFVISDLLSSTPFAADKQRHAWPRSLPNHRPGLNKNGLGAVLGSSFHFPQNVFRKIKPKITRELRKHSLNKEILFIQVLFLVLIVIHLLTALFQSVLQVTAFQLSGDTFYKLLYVKGTVFLAKVPLNFKLITVNFIWHRQ